MTLVVAPAGYGKTTLLAQYAHACDGPVGWLRVESADATVDRLTARMWAAVPGAVSRPDEADTGPAPPRLIIDDLHLAGAVTGGAALDRLLTAAPAGLHVMVGSRHMPSLNLSRHELAESVIIDADLLRFRTWEVERLLREVYREPLPGDDVAALSRRVGGWAAGLKLFHLSTHGRPLAERRRAVAALDGRSTLSRAYLARTVLADLPESLRRFLVRSCVFDVLTAPRCDRLLGSSDSQRQLERLERRQAFTTSHDGGRTFTYHEVLRAHLLAELAEELGEAAARRWHAHAARILAEDGALEQAARAYARAEDWAAVRRLLDRIGADVAGHGLDPWSDLLPSWFVAEDPWLALAEGRHRMNHGQLDAALAALRRAEAMFSTEPGRARCRAARAAVRVWLPGTPAARGHWTGWLRAATRRYPAVVAAEAESLRDPAAPLVRAAGQLLAGDATAARRALTGADADGQGVVGLACRLLLAACAMAQRDPHGAAALTAVAADAEHAHLPWFVRVAHAAAALDGTEAGAKEARAVAEECDRLGDRWGACLATGLALFGESLTGRLEPHDAARLLELVRALDAGVLVAWAQSLLALATATAGLPDAELEVRRAESTARAAGVPGARVMALAAGAAAAGGSAERLAGALAAADQAGLPGELVTAWITGGRGDAPGLVGPSTDARLSLWCFGGFRLCVDGQPVNWAGIRPQVRTLMRILALHAGRPVHRDTIIGALWPAAGQAQATRGLHVALSTLRNFLDEVLPEGASRLLRRDGDAYLLALPPDGYADVVAFRLAAESTRRPGGDRLAALRAVVRAYGGELLPEEGSAEWVVHPRESMRRQAAEAAAALAAAELSVGGVGHGDRAAAAAQRCIDIDPFHDGGWRLLVAAHQRAGNLAAAARTRRDYAAVLASLGVPPPAADDPPDPTGGGRPAGRSAEPPVGTATGPPAGGHSRPKNSTSATAMPRAAAGP
ncbi:MAG TPA: BTAD domain-containing putative transcriptional regulator [Pilimelia sp.]|nr:BTAD domain-containing putative transcriptional regulator [Pilimelia sp.]